MAHANNYRRGSQGLTNPCVYKFEHGKRVLDKEATADYKNREVLSNEEIDDMIKAADNLKIEYYQLRAKCLIAIAKKFGKRRIEITRLKRLEVEQIGDDLQFKFTIAKKHKKGLFQYIKETEKLIKEGKTDPSALSKTLPEIKADWRSWQETEQGHRYKTEVALQAISIQDKYVKHVLDYLQFLSIHYPKSEYLFPSGIELFGSGQYIVDDDKHLSGSQLLRIIKPLNPSAWLHLFRETKGAEISKRYGRTITAISEVRESLDLEQESTAYRYVRRYAAKKQEAET